jgi:hypothetical protein
MSAAVLVAESPYPSAKNEGGRDEVRVPEFEEVESGQPSPDPPPE